MEALVDLLWNTEVEEEDSYIEALEIMCGGGGGSVGTPQLAIPYC